MSICTQESPWEMQRVQMYQDGFSCLGIRASLKHCQPSRPVPTTFLCLLLKPLQDNPAYYSMQAIVWLLLQVPYYSMQVPYCSMQVPERRCRRRRQSKGLERRNNRRSSAKTTSGSAHASDIGVCTGGFSTHKKICLHNSYTHAISADRDATSMGRRAIIFERQAPVHAGRSTCSGITMAE